MKLTDHGLEAHDGGADAISCPSSPLTHGAEGLEENRCIGTKKFTFKCERTPKKLGIAIFMPKACVEMPWNSPRSCRAAHRSRDSS